MQPHPTSGSMEKWTFWMSSERTCAACGEKGSPQEDPFVPWFCSDCLEHARSHTLWDDIGVGD